MAFLSAMFLAACVATADDNPRRRAGDSGSDSDPVDHCGNVPTSTKVTLPADDGLHASESIEWWYWTAHLKTAQGRSFGVESVFFHTTQPMDGTMAHFAISDIDDPSFHCIIPWAFGAPSAVANGFDLAVDSVTATGGDGHDTLHGEVDDYVLDLQVDAAKPVVFQHDQGYTDYPSGGYTYYYSRERMTATGNLTVGGVTLPVTGAAWFDHQYGDIMSAIDTGWDWFALQLDDQREIMLFILRVNGAPELIGGSYTDAQCVTTTIAPEDFSITPLGEWTSPTTGCTYPSGWTITVADMTFTVTPLIADQELEPGVTPTYWEGASEVTGDATGQAYVELTGYCQ